ncbi:MAG: NAD(P)/FAD-dependent oxidoreductase [Candidatus Sericytochromatia bacterium]|nr:NAD(P)/FAD-dependent oxidoreductase [Candidatus Sericytochromatia bacterium]
MNIPEFTIAGAGLAGALLALTLGRRGHRVRVLERRPDPRKVPQPPGRSINMALSTRGRHALACVGLEEKVLEKALPMRGRMIHGQDETLELQPYGIHPEDVILSIGRAELNMLLVEEAERCPEVEILFDQGVDGFDAERKVLTWSKADGSRGEEAFLTLFGTDGAFSAVRRQMQRRDRFDYEQQFIDWGYKEISFPAQPDGAFAMDPGALHIWPRGNHMLIGLPNPDGSFTGTLFLPFEGAESFANLESVADARQFFREWFPDALPMLPDFDDSWRENPVRSLVLVKCDPWIVDDCVALVGDAAHAVVPFYGQGMNASFEDVVVLAEELAMAPEDRRLALSRYAARRKPHTDALAELAMCNFVEMRDSVAKRSYKWRHALDQQLQRWLPDQWMSLYHMVTFTRLPYAEAKARAERQDRLVRSAAIGIGAGLAWMLLRGSSRNDH